MRSSLFPSRTGTETFAVASIPSHVTHFCWLLSAQLSPRRDRCLSVQSVSATTRSYTRPGVAILAGVSLRASSKFFLTTRHQHQETTSCHRFKPAGLYGSGLHGTPVCETLHFRCRFSAYQTFWTDDCLRVPISPGQRSKHQPLLSLMCR